jgi:FAD/FMN-containing dehydrogenase
VSDVVHGRLRALLGTAGVERDAAGLPRAIPDSADALSLVCRLAHDEGWKIRIEGQGTWLPADAPADLAVSTRALDQVVSVSPADLVATV